MVLVYVSFLFYLFAVAATAAADALLVPGLMIQVGATIEMIAHCAV